MGSAVVAVRFVCPSLIPAPIHIHSTGAFRTGRLAVAIHTAGGERERRLGEIVEIGDLALEDVHNHSLPPRDEGSDKRGGKEGRDRGEEVGLETSTELAMRGDERVPDFDSLQIR
jgi:hypothetical protein